MPLCPVCQEKMVPVREAGVEAASCRECRGTWISAAALQRRARNESAPGQPHTPLAPTAALANEAAHSDTAAALVCPTCAQTMVKERFHPGIPVQIDRCTNCDYIWLDAGELGLLIRLYRELPARQGIALSAERQQQLEEVQAWQSQPQTTSSSLTPSSAGSVVLGLLTDFLLWPKVGSSGHQDAW